MPKSTMTSRMLVTIPVAADYLGVCQRTVRRRIADGTIRGYRFGPRSLRVDLNEVEAALRPIPTASGPLS